MKTTLALILTLLFTLSGYGVEATIAVTEKDTQWIGTLDTVTGKVTKVATLPKRTDVKDPRFQEQEDKLRDIVYFEGNPIVWRGSWQSQLLSWDGKEWKNIPAPQNTSNGSAEGGMEVRGNTLYLSDMQIGGPKDLSGFIGYNLKTKKVIHLQIGNTLDVALGEEGFAYAIVEHKNSSCEIRLIDLTNWKLEKFFVGLNARIYSVAYKNEKLFLVTENGDIIRLSTKDGKPEKKLKLPGSPVLTDIDIADDGTVMIGGFEGKVFVTSTELEELKTFQASQKSGDYDTVFSCFKKVEKPTTPPRPKGGSDERPQYAVK